MTHERLNSLEIVPLIQEGRGKSMPHDVGVNPLLDQRPFYHGSDEIVNRFVGQAEIPQLGGEARVKTWEPGTWKRQIIKERGKRDRRHVRNRLFRPKWERNRLGDKRSPVSLERRGRKATR